MFTIAPCPIPAQTFLHAYAQRDGHYADCFTTEVSGDARLPDLIAAFFDSPVLRLERRILALVGAASSPAQVTALAQGQGETLALWQLEERAASEIILKVSGGRIRTWLMVEPAQGQATRLYFGSAVVPEITASGAAKLGFLFRALSGFHKLYARLTLWSAKRQLTKRTRLNAEQRLQ